MGNCSKTLFDQAYAIYPIKINHLRTLHLSACQHSPWLNQFASRPLNDRQRLALVYLQQHGEIHNSDYRRLNRVDPMTAGQELRDLVDANLVEQQGVGRGTSYRLKAPPELAEQWVSRTDEEKILAYVRQHGSINNTACRGLLDADEARAYYLLKKLCDISHLKPEGKGKWRRYLLP